MLLKDKPRDFRFITFGIVIVYLLVFLFYEFYVGSYAEVAKYLIFSPAPYFVDLQILLYGVDAIRDHINPYTVICFPESPAARNYFLYPIVWGFLTPLPFVTLHNSLYLGIGLVVATFISLYFFIGKVSLRESLIYSLILLSPAIMLCIERGNSDLIIFLMLLIPVLLSNSKILLSFLVLFVSMLKLFPLGAAAGILYRFKNAEAKKSLILLGIVLVAFALYLVIMKENIAYVFQKGTRPYTGPSYGLGTIPTSLIALFRPYRWYICIGYTVFLVLVFLFFYSRVGKKISGLKLSGDKAGLFFLIGAGTFMASYIIGYNHEYRFVFLLFTIPQLFSWATSQKQLINFILLIMILILWRQPVHLILHSYPYFLFIQVLGLLLFYFYLIFMWSFIKENGLHVLRSAPSNKSS